MAANNPQALKIVSLILKLFCVIPLLIGLGHLAGAGFTVNRQYTILETRPTVDAEVVRSELTHYQKTFVNDANATTVYETHVDFRYAVGGKPHTTSVGSDYATSSYAEMKQKVATYSPETHHAIRYNPSNPIDIRYDAGFAFEFFMGPLILAGAGLVFAGWAPARERVRCPSFGAVVKRTGSSCPDCGAAPWPGSAAKASGPC